MNNKSFACLTYHVIGDNASQYSVTESQLRAHLALLKNSGYVINDFEQLELAIQSGQRIPARRVIITVDDGHESSMRAADLLHQYACSATFFLTRDRCLQETNFLRESQIRELRKCGFSVGAHGTSHRKLTFMPAGACKAELAQSKQWLEDVLGEPVHYMAAPGGYVNRRVLRLAYECGYTLVGTCREWMNSIDRISLPSTINRVNVRRHFSPDTVRHAAEGAPAFYFRRQLRSTALALPKLLFR